MAPLLSVRNVSKHFGGLMAVSNVSFEQAAGRDRRPDRTQWRGQDYAL